METLADLVKAHDEVVAAIRMIPDAALDWRPGDDGWSLRQIIGHLAHANDFYIMIVAEARASNFSAVELRDELEGWRRMRTTDAAISQCTTVPDTLDCFEHAYQRMLSVLKGITIAELDRPFVFLRPGDKPLHTTLRHRVVQMATSHIREHQPHLADTLKHWQTSQH